MSEFLTLSLIRSDTLVNKSLETFEELSHVESEVLVGVELLQKSKGLSVVDVDAHVLQPVDELVELYELVLIPVDGHDEVLGVLVQVWVLESV
jgi:hypothetical protein